MPAQVQGRSQVWLAIARDLLLMGIGGLGLIREIFFKEALDMQRTLLFLGMVAGSGALNALWLLRNTPGGTLPSNSRSSAPPSPSSPPSP